MNLLRPGQTSTVWRADLVPPGLKILSHAVSCLANRTVIFVERLAVVEYLPHVGTEFIPGFVARKEPTDTLFFLADSINSINIFQAGSIFLYKKSMKRCVCTRETTACKLRRDYWIYNKKWESTSKKTQISYHSNYLLYILQSFLNSRQIHRTLDDFLVRRKLLRVHRKQERPCIVMTFQIF